VREERHQLLVVIPMEAACFRMSHALVVEEDRMVLVKATISLAGECEPFNIISCVPCLESDVCLESTQHETCSLLAHSKSCVRRNGMVEQRKGGPAFQHNDQVLGMEWKPLSMSTGRVWLCRIVCGSVV
jgi:hypothetical protein